LRVRLLQQEGGGKGTIAVKVKKWFN